MGEGQVPLPGVIRNRLHDPNVMLEEYFYYAKIQRQQEKDGLGPTERAAIAGHEHVSNESDTAVGGYEEKGENEKRPQLPRADTNLVSANEWETASRAARNATWPSM